MLDQDTIDLARGANFAVLTTLLPDGHPQTHVMWVDSDGQDILLNTEIHRRKFRNIVRDARVTVTIIDADNPYHYAEIRGVVSETIRGQAARDHIDALSHKYSGRPYGNPITSERVMLRISPTRVVVH